MAAIGSLVFCTDCGNLLDGSAGKQNAILTCQVCGAQCKGMFAPVGWSLQSAFARCSAGLTWTIRHIVQDHNHAIQAYGFSLSFARETIRSADDQ
jgi:hypothetical protein